MERVSRRDWNRDATPLVARVEWRAEGRHAEHPAALWMGGERLLVVVEERWVEGPAVAGGRLVHGFVVRDEAGRVYRVRRRSGHGTIVERAT